MLGDDIKKILVIYKKSALELARERKNEHILGLIAKGDPSVASYQSTHYAHVKTLETLRHQLEKYFDKVDFRYRATADLADKYDLIVTVGGDGTFLWASKLTNGDTPIVGINSAPDSSVGYYTCTSLEGISSLVHDLHEGSAGMGMYSNTYRVVKRIQVAINGTVVNDRVLNDVLFAAEHSAGTAKYILEIERTGQASISEEQKSSGIWISTPTGSTGANLSAGGWILPWEDDRLQYVVREPYRDAKVGCTYHHTHGFIEKNAVKTSEKIRIINKMRRGMLSFDGTTLCTPVTTGDVIEISHSKSSLVIFGSFRW